MPWHLTTGEYVEQLTEISDEQLAAEIKTAALRIHGSSWCLNDELQEEPEHRTDFDFAKFLVRVINTLRSDAQDYEEACHEFERRRLAAKWDPFG